LRFRYSTLEDGKPVKKAAVYTQDEHHINLADVDSDAVHIIERLDTAGFETYIVGGAIRDLLLGKKPKDFDIVSTANPNQIKKLFRTARIIGHRFRLVHVSAGTKLFEVSTFRSLKNGPTSNTFGTIEEDVLRRDFSLNALFYDPKKQLVVDYVDAMKDIHKKVIRPIIPLAHIFTDDPVRMIRAVKYAASTGFTLPVPVRWKIHRQSHLLANISPSRLTEEFFKIIRSSSAAKIVEALEAFGLYKYLQPNASVLMKEKSAFREKYLQSLAALNQKGAGTTEDKENLAGFIRDYLETIIDWNENAVENYKRAFSEARQFVLPMNPPRFELDNAVRLVLKSHGVVIKRSLFSERDRPFSRRKKTDVLPTGETELASSQDTSKTKKARRKRNRGKTKNIPDERKEKTEDISDTAPPASL
jgi:poly(A) polymerase